MCICNFCVHVFKIQIISPQVRLAMSKTSAFTQIDVESVSPGMIQHDFAKNRNLSGVQDPVLSIFFCFLSFCWKNTFLVANFWNILDSSQAPRSFFWRKCAEKRDFRDFWA